MSAAEIALADSHGAIKGHFVAILQAGKAVEKKRPPVQTHEGALRFLCEVLHHRPEADVLLIELTWNDDLWLSDGICAIEEALIAGPLGLPSDREASLRYREGSTELWLKTPPHAGARKVGAFPKSHDAIRHLCRHLWAVPAQEGAE